MDDPEVPDFEYGARLLEFAGVCTLPMAVRVEVTRACRDEATRLTVDVRARVRDLGIDPDGSEGFRFAEAHQRGPGRVDLRDHPAVRRAPFDDRSFGEDALWRPLIQRVLGPDAILLWKVRQLAVSGTAHRAFALFRL